jgi:tetratricopeptide (TPR) repeat protein
MYLQGFDKALSCYTRAIEIDPDYAEAYAALANIHFLFTMNLIHSPHEGFNKTRFYAEKALALNDEIAAAHFTLGQVHFWFDWDFGKALSQYEKAANAAVPFYSTGVTIDPWYHAFIEGDFDKAVNSTLKIIETDPLSVFNQFQLSCHFTWGRRPDQAREVLNKIIKMVPNYSDAYRLLAYNSFIEGDSRRAVEEARKAVVLSHGLGWSQITLSIVLAQDGQTEESIELLNKLQDSRDKNNISPLGIALIYTYLGDYDNAFNYLEEAIKYKDQWIVSLKYGPEYDPLRSDPRFDVIIAKIDYPKIPRHHQFNLN